VTEPVADPEVIMMLVLKWWSALLWGLVLVAAAFRLVRSGPLWLRAVGILVGIAGAALWILGLWVRLGPRRAG
jgi:uncharacterized membrane protein YuzA (DUF378 family)